MGKPLLGPTSLDPTDFCGEISVRLSLSLANDSIVV